MCQQAGVEQDTDPRGAGHLQFSKKKKGRIGNSTNQMKASLNLCTGDGHSLAPLLTEYNSCDALVAVSVAAYMLNGASLRMLSF